MTDGNAAPDPDCEPIFAALLTPHRSLSSSGFLLVMGLLIACSFFAGFAFWLMGAWPVVGFFGLDIALVNLAFRASYRSARAFEEVAVFADRLVIRRTDAKGRADEVTLNPYWARLEVDRHPEIGVTRVGLRSHGSRVDIARFLGPHERESFAEALGAALAKVRAA